MNISVCMASYNGKKFIRRQIVSILNQLSMEDELIIIDDASIDNTTSIIKKLNDKRIKLSINKKNIGPVKTFNNALNSAKNELIFLSDQDDFWLPKKVSVVKKNFKKKNIDVLIHDAKILKKNKIIKKSLFEIHNSSSGLIKNLISNRFTGCCMILKKECLKEFLPIPIKKGIYHDAWLGLLSIIFKKNILFLKEQLIEWNRHENNETTLKRRTINLIIPDRINLIASIFMRIIFNK